MNYCFQHQTKKVFFKKYIYKVSISLPIASVFRGGNLLQIEKNIEEKRLQLSKSSLEIKSHFFKYHHFNYSLNDIERAKLLLNTLGELTEGYVLRVERCSLNVYFNNKSYINLIRKIANVVEVWEPLNDNVATYLLRNPKSIVSNKSDYKYKVTVKPLTTLGEDFKKWAKQLPKIKLASKNYQWTGHFYVVDDKTLSLCRIYLGNSIQKVEEITNINKI